MNEFTPELSIVGIVGALVPFAAQLLKRPSWSSEKRRIVAAATALILALIALVGIGAFTDLVISSPQQVVVVCLGVLGVAQLVFTALQAAVPSVMNSLEAVGAPKQQDYTPRHMSSNPEAGMASTTMAAYRNENEPVDTDKYDGETYDPTRKQG